MLLGAALALQVQAQATIEQAQIKKETTDTTSALSYGTLAAQFEQSPAQLDLKQVQYLYYGRLYAPSYKLYNISAEEIAFNKFLASGKYRKALEVGQQLLGQAPASLEVLAKLNVCYRNLDMPQEQARTKVKIDRIVEAITASGDGSSKESAYQLVSVGDEYALMAVLGKEGSRKRSVMGQAAGGYPATTDEWEVKDQRTKQKQHLFMAVLLNLEAMPKFEKQ